MPKTPSINSSFTIPSVSNAFSSFYTKQPLIAITTAIVLPILGILGLLYLRMKSGPIEEKINEFTDIENISLKDALNLQEVETSGGNRLCDRLSFFALKKNDLEVAYQCARNIKGDTELRTYALCRIFNHIVNPKNKSEGYLDQAFINIAKSCHGNPKVQDELTKKIFMRFLEEDKRELAYNAFLKGNPFNSALIDHLSIQLFDACVKKNDRLLAKKAVDNIANHELQESYIQKYREKWGTY